MADKKKTVEMKISVAGSPSLSAKRRYELSEDLAKRLIKVGYAVEVEPETRRGRKPKAEGSEDLEDDENASETGGQDDEPKE